MPILLGSGSYADLIPPELRPLGTNEAALESALMRRGLGFVLADPARFMRLSLSRIPVYFLFWPTADSGGLSNLTRVGSFNTELWRPAPEYVAVAAIATHPAVMRKIKYAQARRSGAVAAR